MLKKFTINLILLVFLFWTANNLFAQDGPCILGVGNCPPNNNNNNTGNRDPGNRTLPINDERAAEIIEAKKNNAKYLLVLQKYYDTNLSLWCEERAWIGANYSGDSTMVVVNVGPTKKVCFEKDKVVWTAKDVNNGERWIDYWSTMIFNCDQYEQQMAEYLNKNRNNPQAVTYAQTEMSRMQAWKKYYREQITNYRNEINKFAPSSI